MPLFRGRALAAGEINPLFKVGRALLALSEIVVQAALRAEFLVRKPVADKTEPAVTYLTARLLLRDFGVFIFAHSSGSPRRMRKDYRQLCQGQFFNGEGDRNLLGQPYLLALVPLVVAAKAFCRWPPPYLVLGVGKP